LAAKARVHGPNTLRIIGGRWRGRKLRFPPVEGLRPSPDRVRETLFNWLQPFIEGARCLDLFAGSGAFGLEALSRGAAEVVLVDREPRVIAQLEAHRELLGAEGLQLVRADALAYLQGPPSPFDIVFLDPPFRRGLLGPCCEALAAGWLQPGARVYIEAEAELEALPLPAGWEVVRSKRAGQVGSHLIQIG
jgi:16S rRNA (guanine966-N2)-methyltransferase